MKNFFAYLVERNDKENIDRISEISKNVLNQLETYYSNLLKIYFPLPKQVDDHEKFMDWRTNCRRYENNLPKYLGRSFSIQSGRTSPTLGGEYFDNKIYIYDEAFYNLYQELRNNHFSFEYNLRGIPSPRLRRQNTQIKKEAKLIHEKMMQVFNSNKENYLSTLFHEIVHLLDHDKMGDKFNKVSQNATDKLNKQVNKNKEMILQIYNNIYFNNDIETNAWFLSKAQKSLTNNFSTFQDLLKDFQSHFANFWKYLTQDKQRKMINRLFKMYNS